MREQFAGAEPLFGRAREQSLLRERLGALRRGRGGLVLIGGEAGIGKTTLAGWLVAEARLHNARTVKGACYDLLQAPPYGPWREALAQLAVAPGTTDPPFPWQRDTDLSLVANQDLLFAQIREFLAAQAAQGPLVLLLEDLHWSDPASVELLRFLARDSTDLPLLIVATYRANELTRQHALSPLLPHLVREAQALRLDLLPLSAVDIHTLLRQRYVLREGDRDRLATYLEVRSAGNPFYLTEILYTLESNRLLRPSSNGWEIGDLTTASVPPLVRQIIEARLEQFGPDARRLLPIAAVIGQEVSLDLWRSAADADDDQIAAAVEQAIAAHMITLSPESSSVTFTHDLVRETFYLGQSLTQRLEVHQRVATLLSERPDPPLNEVASHYGKAGDPQAIDWLVRAGERALALHAAQDAVAALTRAHELAGRQGRPLHDAAYRARAQAYTLLGEFDHARRDYELVLERSRTAGDQQTEWQVLVDLGLHWSERDYGRTGSYVQAALALARAMGDDLTVAHSLNRLANWHVNLDEPDLALPMHRQALEIFERCGDQAGIADTLDLLGMASYLNGDLSTSTAYCERGVSLLRSMNDRPRLATGLATLALSRGHYYVIGEPAYREESYWLKSAEEALAIAREIGWGSGQAFAHFTLSVVTGTHGQLGRALDHAESAMTCARRVGHLQWTVAAHFALAWTWAELRALDRAIAELEEAMTLARTSGSRYWRHAIAGLLASLLAEAGRLDHAALVVDGVLGSQQPSRTLGQQRIWLARAELRVAQGDPQQALTILDALTSRPDAETSGDLPYGQTLRGDILFRMGDHEAAERAYQAAHRTASLFGFRTAIWKIDAARARLLIAAGREGEAAEAVVAANVVIAELAESIPEGALRAAFQTGAQALLPSASPNAARTSPHRLSPREREVLRLIAGGQSDREIAAALSISPRTVMRHVAGILAKLDVPSRTAAAAHAIRHELV